MTTIAKLKTGLAAAVLSAAFTGAAVAGEFAAELTKTDTAISASVDVNNFQRGELAFQTLRFSAVKEHGLDTNLVGEAVFTFSDAFNFEFEAEHVVQTGETDLRFEFGTTNLVTQFGDMSFGLKATNELASGSATLSNGSVFGLTDVDIMSEFQKDFGGSGTFSMSLEGKTKNGLSVAGSASFDSANPESHTFGLKVSGKF